MRKNKLEPNIALTIYIHGYNNIPFVVTDSAGVIKHITDISRIGTYYSIRRSVINKVTELVDLYKVDTLILTQNKLFVDKIDKYPDPYILNNVCLNYGLKISIEDNYYNYVKYIMEYSKYEWRKYVLGHNKYGVDLFKNHVLNTIPLTEAEIEEVGSGRYFEVLCMSDVVKYNTLLNKKYQINNE